MIGNFFKKFLYKVFTSDKWNIGFVYQTPENLIQNKKFHTDVTWLKEDNVDYAADPFVVHINDKIHVYYEELNFWKGRGEIMMINDFHFKNKKKISGIQPKTVHLSYPYLFKDGVDIYCIPETSEALEVGLYKIDNDNPEKLEKIRVLIYGKPFVDSSLVYYNGKYWLFTSVTNEDRKLYIFFSDSLDGVFTTHHLNPIEVDINMCRSAGSIIIVENKLYMPTQNPKNCYGGSVVINKITLLDEYTFKCEPSFELFPEAPYEQGLHNISFSGNLIILDGKRKVFSLLMPLKKIIKKIKSRANTKKVYQS